MKKIFTLICALAGFASMSSAASVDDIAPLKHSYVLVCDEWNNNGTEKIASGAIYGNGFFFTPTGHDCSVKKGTVNLSVVNEADDNHVTAAIAAKYGQEYDMDHYNSLRLKNNQDIMVMKVTAGSKLIFFLQGNNKVGKEARIPKLWKGGEGGVQKKDDCTDANALNPKPTEDHPKTDAGFRFEYTVDDDMTLWVGSWNGDMFLSYVIVEANEAPGTPAVKVGSQTYESGLWFKEVSCSPREAYGVTTDVYYTTDGSTPSSASTKYTEPIKCYAPATVKFQAYVMGMAVPDAENEAIVDFSFDAPEIAADGASFTITTPYAEQNGTNYYTLNGGEEVKGDGATLTESATVSAYTKIANGDYATFTSKKSSKDVYVLNPIKEKKTIEVIAGDVVLDEEATATSTTGEVYTVENGEISADKMDFFVKNLTFKALKDEQYQVPAGNERYIQMSNTNITFQVAEGDSVTVKVICSKNSCKNIDADDAEDGSQVTDRKCYVNVNGTNYAHMEMMEVTYKDQAGNDSIVVELAEAADMKLFENANIIEFGLGAGTYTFQKYSGTGNILISSIEIAPAAENPQELEIADFADGKYYLVNVSTNKAWGCANSWGTQGSLVKHPEYVILHKQENGTYFMETQASNGGEQYYFNGEWMDNGTPAALNIIKGEELGEDMDGNPVYVYYITVDTLNYYGWDGTENTVLARNLPAGDEKAMWVIASHEQAVAGLAEATEEDPMDATFLILDPNFNRNNRNQGAWTMEASNQNLCGGKNENKCAESWRSAFTLSQTIEVPNGKYILNAQAALTDYTDAYDGTDYPVVYANDATSKFIDMEAEDRGTSMDKLSDSFTAGKYQVEPITVIVTDGKLTVGVKGTRTDTWCIWDNFELEYCGPASEPTDPNELIINGDCEGADGSCLVVKHGDGGGSFTTNFVEGAGIDGSRAAVVHATSTAAEEWDTQFFIYAKNHVFALGEKFKLTFWVKADKDAQADLQAHTTPGNYCGWYLDGFNGPLQITTEWKEVVIEGTISDAMSQYGAVMSGMQTVAFNLNKDKTLENNYYFDNISWKLVTEDGIESMVAEKAFNGAIYNLAGQKVDANYKGVVIKNGKKMMQK